MAHKTKITLTWVEWEKIKKANCQEGEGGEREYEKRERRTERRQGEQRRMKGRGDGKKDEEGVESP